MSSTMITDYVSYNTSSMVFMPAIKFFRIPIRTRNTDGSVGNLVFAPSNLFTFGVSENKNDMEAVNGYSLPLVLWNKEGPSDDQKSLTLALESIIEECKHHLIKDDVRKSIGKPTLKYDALEKLDKLLYWKLDENGERVAGKGPSMYPKLYTRRAEDGGIVINTEFFDRQGNILDGHNLVGKYGNVTPAISFDCIYIGASISIQVRVMEAELNLTSGNERRLLPRPSANTRLASSDASYEQDSKPRLLNAAPAEVQVNPDQSTTHPVAGDDQQDDVIVDEQVEQSTVTVVPPRATPKRAPVRARK